MSEDETNALLAQVLSAYLSRNSVAPADLPFVINAIKAALNNSIAETPAAFIEKPAKFKPVIPVKDSVTPDAVSCLCCGKALKSLNRHIRAEHGLTPDTYRAGFNLEKDHPLVAPNLTRQRSDLAKASHSERKLKTPEISEDAVETES